ncbi:pyrroline-5-carboxylate reductase [Candidatus Providencia siddallii]|uniref:Pyrroline-5-carboxylate reductase n=1 Tax=Candidatus Providencia siddallii TaxID=1715285 RepID=A0ABM9NNM4_9GAMM
MKYRKIAFIGSGNIVNAMVSGIVKYGKYKSSMITISSPNNCRRNKIVENYNVIGINDNNIAVKNSDVIILAVKPQVMEYVCKSLRKIVDYRKKLILTLAAGITVNRYNEYFDDKINLIRIMPSILSFIGKGIIGIFTQNIITEENKIFIEKLMKSIGDIIWCKEEHEINNITAISGSSPAYIFLFMEAIQQKAEELGYNKKISRKLIFNIFNSSLKFASFQKDICFSELRKKVMSEGGVTEKALNEFYNGSFKQIIGKIMQNVIDKSKEMENKF